MKKLSDFSDKNYSRNNKKRQKMNNKVVSSILTLFVALLLVLAGPVQAFHLGIEGLKSTPYSFNERIDFIGNVNINNNELLDIKNISIEINGQNVCSFNLNGSLVIGCSGMDISLIGSPAYGYGQGFTNFEIGWNGANTSVNAGNYNGTNYGYGYGYSNGQIRYNVSIQSPQSYLNNPGNNQLKLLVNTQDQTFNSRIESFVIQPQSANNGNSNSGGNSGSGGNEERRNTRITNPSPIVLNIVNTSTDTVVVDSNDPRTNDKAFDELKEEVIKQANLEEPSKDLKLLTGMSIVKSMSFEEYIYLGIVFFLVVLVIFGFWFHKKRSNRFINRYLGYY